MKFQTEQEIDEFLESLEAGTIPKEAWTHQAHLAIAGVYVWREIADADGAALPRLRFGILSLNRRHGTRDTIESGYHETLTVFWVSIVRDFCSRNQSMSRLQAINEMMETLPSSLFKQFYSFDVVKSPLARERWVGPDLLALPGDTK